MPEKLECSESALAGTEMGDKMSKNDADQYRPIPRLEDAKSPTEQREALAVYENYALTVVPEPTFGRLVDETEVMDQLLAFIQDDNGDGLEGDAEDNLRSGPEDGPEDDQEDDLPIDNSP